MSSMATGIRCSLYEIALLIALCFIRGSHAGSALSLNNDNIDSVLNGNEVVFVNFYADWCRFSQILGPVFDEASKKISEEFPETGKVIFAKVDSDTEVTISGKYRITKYPTLKLFRNGEVMKKEYRGQRTADALADFIRKELKDPVTEHSALHNLKELDRKKRNVIGYFENKESDNYKTFARVASTLHDDCNFHATFGAISAPERVSGDRINFRPPNTDREDIVFMGHQNNFDQLNAWTFEKCVPLVREITFENAEALTEEGLPFLLLFHHPDDTAIVETYNNEVAKQLLSEKTNVNFLVADGTKFTHPLHHLGKSLSDLPILAIDSFRHMYVFPNDVKKDLDKPGLLKQFVEDLHSGKLHRDFHHGGQASPYPTPPEPSALAADGSKPAEQAVEDGDQPKTEEAEQPKAAEEQPKTEQPHLPKDVDQPQAQKQQQQQQQQQQKPKQTQPPESLFKRLAPSRSRYTILRDEL